MNLKLYGYNYTETPPENLIAARVTEVQYDRCTVVSERGELAAKLKGTLHYNAEDVTGLPCVGDFVYLQYNGSGPSLITQILPRHSKFSRSDDKGHASGYVKTYLEQVVAVNFDYVFIVTSLNRDFRITRIMRYLTQTRQSGGLPVIVLTKADLLEDFNTQVAEVSRYAPDVPVHAVSSHTGFGLEALREYLRPGKTVVFLGMSGVGKSSLLNALANEDLMNVKQMRGVDESKGRHTTTHRQLFMLPGGAMVIDTPGMRTMGVIDAEEAITAEFADVEDLFIRCKFGNCRHKTEPGCAVLAAIADGSLPGKRWEQYQTQVRENRYVDDKAGFMRERNAQHKSWTISSRKQMKGRKNKK